MRITLPRLAFAMVMMLLASAQSSAMEVISNPGNETSSLSISTLRSIFSMRMTQWPDGTPIRVFVMSVKDPIHAEFSKQILRVFPHQLRRAWDRQIYSGTGQAPAQVSSEAEMRNMVANTPGAIGYLAEDQTNENLRVIEID